MNAAWQDGPPFDDFEGPYRPSIESATSLRDQLLLGAAAAVLCSAASLIVAFARRVASGAPATCVPGQTGEGDHSGQQQRHADEQDPLLAEAAASSRPPPPPPQRWLSDEDRDPRGPWPAADAADGERAGDQAQRLLLPAPSRRTPRSEQPLQFWSHQSDSARTPERGQRDAKQRDAKHQQQQQQQPVRRPFTFRAPGLGDAQPGRDDFGAPQWGRERPFDALARGAERRTSRRPSENMAAHANGFGRRHEDGPEIVDFTPPRQGEGWDPDLLHRCTQAEAEISSVEGLQRSPLYRRHVREKGLTYEMATDHRMRVYRAMRRADPEGFAALLSRTDLKDYEQRPPHRLAAALEAALSGAAAVCLLLAPAASPALQPHRAALAALWLLLAFLAARQGSGSPAGLLLGIFETRGPHQLPASFLWVVLLALADCAFLLLTVGLGTLPNVAFRAATGQGVVERLLGMEPAVEVERPARISPAPRPARPSGAGAGPRGAAVTPRRLD